MNISLTPELENYINSKVASGMYHSSSEVVREALRLLAEKDELYKRKLKSLNDDIQTGLNDLDRGFIEDGEQAFQEVRNLSKLEEKLY